MPDSVLIAYYSKTGNTRRLAEAIQSATGGTLCEIEPAVAYPGSYHATLQQAQQEIRAAHRPEIRLPLESLEGFGTILVGTPIWWGTCAPPVATFLERADLAERRVALFCTHGGGGAGSLASDAAQLCAGATLPLLAMRGGPMSGGAPGAEISSWLRRIGLA